jgi:hypothetical protein
VIGAALRVHEGLAVGEVGLVLVMRAAAELGFL